MNHRMWLGFTMGVVLLLSGCQGMMHRQMGKVLSGFAVEHTIPQLMSDDDVGMACETGVSLGDFLISFGRVTAIPEQLGSVIMFAAAMCAEEAVWEEELRGLRALHTGRAPDAQDARIAEKRAHAIAAHRFYRAFQLTEQAFGRVGGECPELQQEDGVFYLVGLISGLLAMIHDRAAEGVVEVSVVPAAVIRATQCLDDATWWGAPGALRATLWTIVPGMVPEGVDGWEILDAAAARGDAAGVRLARALQVYAAGAMGRDQLLREKIADHAKSLATVEVHPAWRLLDRYATYIIRHESDRIWSRSKGHRTPLNGLGEFPDAGAATAPLDDSLLEGLEEDK